MRCKVPYSTLLARYSADADLSRKVVVREKGLLDENKHEILNEFL